ncbi:hypothetical protein L6R52_08505 [Myxococcota bacterium]|nr:hypothetical protein [Myxococcota bacterium]
MARSPAPPGRLRALGRTASLLLFTLATGCLYLLPPAWRALRADPDDVPPAVTRALDGEGLGVASFDQAARTMTTSWISEASGSDRRRQRYVIRWERDPKDGVLTIYVRHEAQDQDTIEDGRPAWGAIYHDGARERAMLDRIQRELEALASFNRADGEGAEDDGSDALPPVEPER